MKKYIYLGALGIFLMASCHHANQHDKHNHSTENHNHETENHDVHNHAHETDEAHGESGDEILLPAQKAKAVGVEVGIATTGQFQQVVKTSGQVMAAQGEESVAVATVAGVVSFSGKVIEGMSVNRGTALVTLSSNNLAEGDPVQKARITYEIQKKEYERKKMLVESRIVSEKDFAEAKQAYENARISYEAVAKNHSAKGQTVVAPIGGYIKNLLVKEGDYVSVGQPLVSITQNRKLFLRADVSEKYYGLLPTLTSANFRTPHQPDVYVLKELNGKLLSYGKTSDSNGYYVPVTFEFDNRGDVIPGSYVEVYLLGTPMEQTITLPRTAITEEQENFFVYQQVHDDCYQKKPVRLGGDNGESVQILSGIHEGDRIVMKGAYQVKLAGATNAIPAHSHEH